MCAGVGVIPNAATPMINACDHNVPFLGDTAV